MMRSLLLLLLAGLLAGLLCLGAGGRLAMRVIAYTLGESAHFSLAGTLRIVALGTAWGGATAPLLFWMRDVSRFSGDTRGVVLGLTSFAIAVTVLFGLLRAWGIPRPPTNLVLLGLVSFGVLFVAYGTLVHRLTALWARGRRKPPHSST